MTRSGQNETQEPRTSAVALGQRLDISTVAEVHRRLGDALREGRGVVVEAGALVDLDVAGLQLLYAGHKHAAATGQRFALEGADARTMLDDAARAWGFPTALGCGSDCPCRTRKDARG